MRFVYLFVLLLFAFVAHGQTMAFTDSNLPIVVIDTRGQAIPDDPKVACRFRVIWNPWGLRNSLGANFSDYDGWAGIEVRGSSSQMFPKLSYGLELWTDSAGTAEVDSTLCGLPAEHDWILSASYSDKTLLRNALTYDLARRLGYWASHVVPCEVVLNGDYVGVYGLMEKVKRGSDRVNISKLRPADTVGNALTGGYIFKIDKTTGTAGPGWFSSYPSVGGQGQSVYFQYESPKPQDLHPRQVAYLAAYVDSFETALHGPLFRDTARGYARYANRASFTTYFLLNELSRNVDGYRISTFLHKNRRDRPGGGRLVAGPAWDYDIAWHNADYCDGELTTGWAWQFNSVCPGDGYVVPFWWSRLTQDSTFRDQTRCRWNDLRRPGQPFSNSALFTWLDSAAAALQEGQQRNFVRWPILGQYVWPNPAPFPTSYTGEISSLKTWLAARLRWLDQNMPGQCRPAPPLAAPSALLTLLAESASIWPSPAPAGLVPARFAFALGAPATVWLETIDATGRGVGVSAPVRLDAGPRVLPVPGTLAAGFYTVRLRTAEGAAISRRLAVE